MSAPSSITRGVIPRIELGRREEIFESLKRKLRAKLSAEQRAALRQRFANRWHFSIVGTSGGWRKSTVRTNGLITGIASITTAISPFVARGTLCCWRSGIGGYQDPKSGGRSLRMWKSIFRWPDLWHRYYGQRPHNARRIRTFQGIRVMKNFSVRLSLKSGRRTLSSMTAAT